MSKENNEPTAKDREATSHETLEDIESDEVTSDESTSSGGVPSPDGSFSDSGRDSEEGDIATPDPM
jgi:hypothetical protein